MLLPLITPEAVRLPVRFKWTNSGESVVCRPKSIVGPWMLLDVNLTSPWPGESNNDDDNIPAGIKFKSGYSVTPTALDAVVKNWPVALSYTTTPSAKVESSFDNEANSKPLEEISRAVK